MMKYHMTTISDTRTKKIVINIKNLDMFSPLESVWGFWTVNILSTCTVKDAILKYIFIYYNIK